MWPTLSSSELTAGRTESEKQETTEHEGSRKVGEAVPRKQNRFSTKQQRTRGTAFTAETILEESHKRTTAPPA